MTKPRIAITMGDPTGVGPEILAKVLADTSVTGLFQPLVIGNLNVLRKVARQLRYNTKYQEIGDVSEPLYHDAIPVLTTNDSTPAELFIPGESTEEAGLASFKYVQLAVRLAKAALVDGITTGPVNKEVIVNAGLDFRGHLEYLVQETGTEEYTVLLCAGNLRVAHLSSHYSLVDACKLVTRENIVGKIRLLHRTATSIGLVRPRIAVAALNPHSGEGGLLGREEIEEIEPAVKETLAEGIWVRGPIPADTVFTRALEGEFDIVLSLYHDQGHIPIKVHDFANSYGVTLGLPIVRTSVDHGTAFEIAGTGRADHRGLENALLAAIEIVNRRRSF